MNRTLPSIVLIILFMPLSGLVQRLPSAEAARENSIRLSSPAAAAQPLLPAANPRYNIIDLGGCEALAISNNGKVAGQCGVGSSARGFFWDNGVMQNLGTLGGSWSVAYGVNGTFDCVEISGLGPGFEYELTILNGQVTLEALNDGVPLGKTFLPLVRR